MLNYGQKMPYSITNTNVIVSVITAIHNIGSSAIHANAAASLSLH